MDEDLEFFSLHDEAHIQGRLRGPIDALRLTSKQMGEYVRTPAFDALQSLYKQIEAKYDEVETSRNNQQQS